ncbi:hypothetical protein [Acidaminococcus intestini]|uniref:hypothetical protein n=1 Tax=Acidaminococcus intestini TaxID=187327 RepID=UPI0030791FFA
MMRRRCRSSSTTKRTCLLLRSIKWLLVPRLGKAERLSPSLRRKHEGQKTGRLEASLLATQRRSITAYMLSFAWQLEPKDTVQVQVFFLFH